MPSVSLGQQHHLCRWKLNKANLFLVIFYILCWIWWSFRTKFQIDGMHCKNIPNSHGLQQKFKNFSLIYKASTRSNNSIYPKGPVDLVHCQTVCRANFQLQLCGCLPWLYSRSNYSLTQKTNLVQFWQISSINHPKTFYRGFLWFES